MDPTIQENDPSQKTTFWFDNYFILFENIQSFFPTFNMNLTEKLNSLMRLGIYSGILITLITGNYIYLYIPIFIGAFTIYIHHTQNSEVENFLSNQGLEYDPTQDTPCYGPTIDNPFMNFNNITDPRDRAVGCKTYNNQELQNNIEQKFNQNLYRDVSDLYSKNNSQREFYQMPSTQSYNDQTAFAKWLYNTGPTCKEDTIKCISEWNPDNNSQVFENLVNH